MLYFSIFPNTSPIFQRPRQMFQLFAICSPCGSPLSRHSGPVFDLRLDHTDIARGSQPQASTEYTEYMFVIPFIPFPCSHFALTIHSRKSVALHLAIGRSISSLCSKASNFRRSRSSAAASTLSAHLRHVCSTKSWWNFQGLIVFETPSKTFFQKFAGHPETFRPNGDLISTFHKNKYKKKNTCQETTKKPHPVALMSCVPLNFFVCCLHLMLLACCTTRS